MTEVYSIPWKAVAVGGVALGVIGALVIASRHQKPTFAKRVALIGDSYAVGLGPELAKLLPDFRYEGRQGTNTQQWANHTAACGECGDWLTAFKPNIVLVSLGVNDGATPQIANYERIRNGLIHIGARVMWILPPQAVKTQSRNVIASVGGLFVPATTTPLATDGLHPQSYAPWAHEIVTAVTRA